MAAERHTEIALTVYMIAGLVVGVIVGLFGAFFRNGVWSTSLRLGGHYAETQK
jgi:hypothetical protein